MTAQSRRRQTKPSQASAKYRIHGTKTVLPGKDKTRAVGKGRPRIELEIDLAMMEKVPMVPIRAQEAQDG